MTLADYLVDTNPEARQLLKKMFWEDCENWDILLETRAKMSGRLVLSDYCLLVLRLEVVGRVAIHHSA